MKTKWGWSDLIDLSPKPSQHTQGTSMDRNDSYAELRLALGKHETPKEEIGLQSSLETRGGETRTNQG